MAKRVENKKNLHTITCVNFSNYNIRELDFNNITKFNGIKAYVLLNLSEAINSLTLEENDDNKILLIAKELEKFSVEPERIYNEYLNINTNSITKEQLIAIKNLVEEPNYILNTTERALLKSQMHGIILEYNTKNQIYESIDYGAIRVCFELVYQAIFIGLDEKKIKHLEFDVAYGDILVDLKIEYENSDEKYNLKENIIIFPVWNSLDELYTNYTQYKTQYISFEENSWKLLATAYETQKQYENRREGKELLSYNGLASNYVSVLEVELKKLVVKTFNVNNKTLTLENAINYLTKCNFECLSKEYIVNKLHEIRKLRNRIAHGNEITYEEFHKIYTLLIENQILKFISWSLSKVDRDKKSTEQEVVQTELHLDVISENENTKKEVKTIEWYIKEAEQDNAHAQFYLADIYFHGTDINQNIPKAIEWYTKAATQGFSPAQFNLGYLYEKGHGMKKSAVKAIEWYTKAAEQGYADAQVNLGNMYANGYGVKKDNAKALYLYLQSAEQGNINAQINLGTAYLTGKGTIKNGAKAIEWYTKAAKQGNSIAQFSLGNMYSTGNGIIKNGIMAIEWYTKAAEQGNLKAQIRLGNMYFTGEGTIINDYKAIKWYTKAAEQGDVNSQINLIALYENDGTRDDAKAMELHKNLLIKLNTKELNRQKRQLERLGLVIK